MTATLRSVVAEGHITASQALAWFAAVVEEPRLAGAVGFAYAPETASWFRLDGAGTAWGSDGTLDLAAVFELRAFDGTRELRWLHQDAGTGPAVALAEDATPLPTGHPVEETTSSAAAPGTVTGPAQQSMPQRVGPEAVRRLAGRPGPAGTAGWCTLTSPRYAPAQIPIDAPPTSVVQIVSAEYAIQDEHGNLSVVDARLIRLQTVVERTEPPAKHKAAAAEPKGIDRGRAGEG
jgi:CRISPR-associated protein (TIGR03984 family)